MDTKNSQTPYRESVLTALETARSFTLHAVENTPDEALFTQLLEGGIHPTWMLGHLAEVDDRCLTWMAGAPSGVSEEWRELFTMGSAVVDRARYPGREELLRTMADRRAALLDWVRSQSETDLRAPAKGKAAECAPDHFTFLLHLSIHEGMHLGQLVLARRQSGCERLYATL